MIRGTSHAQDNRFPDKQKKMLHNSTWPDEYDPKIDLSKVDFELVKIWITKRIEELTKSDDDIPAFTAIACLEENLQSYTTPDAKNMHITLSGVLKEHTLIFMVELWKLLDEAQKSPNGIVGSWGNNQANLYALASEARESQAQKRVG